MDRTRMRTRPSFLRATALLATIIAAATPSLSVLAFAQAQQVQAAKTRTVGTVKAVSGSGITLTTDAGLEITVVLQPSTRLLRLAPGQTDLKAATPAQPQDVEVGDRLLAAGTPGEDGKSVTASSAVIMKKSDITAKQQKEREDWRKRGVGGVVKTVDAGIGTVTISTGTMGGNSVAVHTTKQTIIRRYAPDSVKFDDAKPGTLEQIKPGDQLRARGTKSDDGKELAAEEIVSGTFRNVAGTVVSVDANNSTITVTDLMTKRPVTMKITGDSQMHKLPPMMAQRIAARLKGSVPGAPGGGQAAPASSEGPPSGAGGPRPGGTPDFQQMLSRMPAASLTDLQKGDAVMIVATEGSAENPSSAIILLSGVEPILTAAPSQASTILSPWNLSAGGNIGTGDTP